MKISRLRSIAVFSALGLAMLVLPVAGPAGAEQMVSPAPTACATVMPISEVEPGMMLTGFNVMAGTAPEEFQGEVLGVLHNWLGPGEDVIVVDLSGALIDESGGAWHGQSGSPMYYGDRFVGALSYGVGWEPSRIVGLSPAEDVVKVMDYPPATQVEPIRAPKTGPLPPTIAARIAEATGVPQDQVSGELVPFRVPFGISGAGMRLHEVSQALARRGIPAIVYAAGSAPTAPAVLPTTLLPGDNFSVTIAYGDFTSAAGGTVAYVCGDQAVLFGHYVYGWSPYGPMTLGAHTATSLGLASSPWGTFEMVQAGDLVGTADQDRMYGVRALIGDMPPVTEISVHAYSIVNDRSREGLTYGVSPLDLPWSAEVAVAGNIDATSDRSGEGSSTSEWTIEGTRASGETWQITRLNQYSSRGDISWTTASDLGRILSQIVRNRFEDVEVTSITADASVSETQDYYKLHKVWTSLDGVHFELASDLQVAPGDKIWLRLELRDANGVDAGTTTMKVKVPGDFRGGSLYVGGGSEISEKVRAHSFDELLAALQGRPSNSDAVVQFLSEKGSVKSQITKSLGTVLTGGKWIYLSVMR